MGNPQITSAVLQPNGIQIILAINPNGTLPLVPAGGWNDIGVLVDGVPANVTGTSVQGSGGYIYVQNEILPTSTVVLYSAASLTFIPLRNTDGLEVGNSDGFPVTNNSAAFLTPSGPPTLTAYGVAYDGSGSPLAGVLVRLRLTEVPDGVDGVFLGQLIQATSAGDGTFQIPLIKGAVYLAQGGSGEEVALSIPATGTSWQIDKALLGRADLL